MDFSQSIVTQVNLVGGLVPLKDVKANFHHIYNATVTRIFFCYTKKHYELMHKLTIEWEDGAISTITALNSKHFKIKYKDTYQKINNIPLGAKSRFGWSSRKGKVIKKEHIVSKPTFIFTVNQRLEVNGILVKCKAPNLLRHTKQSSRISRYLVDPRICPMMSWTL